MSRLNVKQILGIEPYLITRKQFFAALVPHQEALIAMIEKERPDISTEEGWEAYASWQPTAAWNDAVLKGLINHSRGFESLDSFAAHGGVNTPEHSDYVWIAFHEGKTIPAEVLKDYPEIMEQMTKTGEKL